MDAKVANRIAKSADGQLLVKYLASKISELDTVLDLKIDDPIALAVEVKARERAVGKLREILEILLAGNETVDNPDPAEYVV